MAPTAPTEEGKDPERVEGSDRVERLIQLQADFLQRARKALANMKRDGSRKSSRLYYSTKLTAFGNMVRDYEANHRELVTLVPIIDRKLYEYFRNDEPTSFEDAQIDYVTAMQAECEAKFPEHEKASAGTNEVHLSSHATLPSVSIPTFSGAHSEWKTFYDLFRSIINSNEKLPGSHKFQYLLGALSGDARDIVAGFEMCDDDYPKAWKALCDVYNDKPSMFMHIMNKFAALESVRKEQPDSLRNIAKATLSCLKSLETVGLDPRQVDAVITFFLISKLPPDTVAYWEETRDRRALPSFDSVKACIETRIRVAAAVASACVGPNQSSTSSDVRPANNKNQHQQSNPQITKAKKVNAYHANNKTTTNSNATVLPPSNPSNSAKAVGRKFSCPICSQDGHPLRTCDKFLAMSASERKACVAKLQYCVNCLAYNHPESKCRSSRTCFTCGERHHSLLHVADSVHHVVAHTITSSTLPTSIVNACNSQIQSTSSSHVLLATAILNVLDGNGKPHALRALIDQGSEANFITESAMNALHLRKQAVQAVICGIGASNGHAKYITTLTLQSTTTLFTITVEALVMGRITNLLPSSPFKPQRWQHLTDLTLADPSYHRASRIDLVLGAGVMSQIIMTGVRLGPIGTPLAQQTQFGWILTGKISADPSRTIHVTSLHATSNIEALMKKFLSVESVEDANTMSSEEQWCEQFFIKSHQRDDTGRFHVRLPFRFLLDPLTTPLGRSRDIAVKRLLQLERRFAQNADLKREYSTAINEYLTLGRMQPTTSNEIDDDGYIRSAYLPHHAVIKESSTSTKLRVVFDASQKTTTDKSLNDMLVVGPTIQNDIVTIIVNWRFHRIACIADVQKMYLQVKVDPADIQYQRIVWRNDQSETIQDYALNRLTFGTSSAPYLAIRSINQLAEDEKVKYPEAAKAIVNDAYVDDVISGGDDVPTVQRLQSELSAMMRSGGFDLKKWASNANEVLEIIPEADRELTVPVELNANDTIKALGIEWHTATDSLGFKATLEPIKKVTKRTALSTIAKLFDPIGLIAPIIVIAKIFMKRVWATAIDWDDTLPTTLHAEWIQYIEGLQHITDIKIPRWINTAKSNHTTIHGFCDASTMAYGAALYIRTIDSHNYVHVHLIASKSRVAPKKALTIPRLELCGAHLLAKLLVATRKGLRHAAISADDIVLWCDSEIVCYWLRSNKQLKVFVENRVAQIHEATPDIRWRHIRTHDNPADLISRGVTPKDLVDNDLWWHGPSWLRLSQPEWPTSRIDLNEPAPPKNIDLELRRTVQANLCVEATDIINRFSSYNRLIRVTALCKRLFTNFKKRLVDRTCHWLVGNPTIDELHWIRRHWILKTQQQHYHDEIRCLSKNAPDPIDDKSKLIMLTPFIDGNGILRVQGRLDNSTLSYDEMHPIILPPHAHFTRLLIDRYHLRSMHGGPGLVSSLLRRQYWIVNARNAIRHRLRNCLVCYRQRAITTHQLMGSLPSARVRSTSRPFVHVGVDYCGPIEIRASRGRGIKAYKAYIAVFVCLTVKAVHIECVDGLTTNAFLAAFRRFISRRGLPSDVYSDNGTNFVGAANEMKREFRKMAIETERTIADAYAEENIRWHFTPPVSPHFGGLWEAGVKSVKFHLHRVIGEAKLTYEEMSTLLCQIEACLNSRPLSALSSNPDDLTPLTPGHFLVNTELLSLPESSVIDTHPNRLNQWQHIQQMRQRFWKLWRSDYLSLLQHRPKWCKSVPNLKAGEMVLVKDDRQPSSKWPLGRIVETHPGDDGRVRVVTVKTSAGTFKRNITCISRLPIYDETDNNAHPSA